jgi:hypothetical protein
MYIKLVVLQVLNPLSKIIFNVKDTLCLSSETFCLEFYFPNKKETSKIMFPFSFNY